MKNFTFLIGAIAFALLLNSCQKESSPAPAATSGTSPDLKTNSLNFTANANCFGSGNAVKTIKNGLVGYYPFLGNANDESGNNNNGILRDFTDAGNNLIGLPTLTYDKYWHPNSAYKLNGISNFIQVPNDPMSYGTTIDSSQPGQEHINKFSIYMRFKTNTPATLLQIGHFGLGSPSIALTIDSAKKVMAIWSFYVSGVGTLTGESVFATTGPTCAPTNSWTDLVVNYSNSNLSIYVNGRLAVTQPSTFSDGFIGGQMYIGAQDATFPQNYLKGSVDEVRVYDRSLTNNEINYLLNH
ncbi:LamG domain-containing protein [Mucilaginibacter sp. McL0603]|uniref:LamG domain-containing protein n=1 Tax=Mucilaginibacter sp. McL0603 TaxID=3415670 RepID=UPI003CEDB161